MVEFSVAWCGSEAGTTWIQREVTGVKGAGGGRRGYHLLLNCYPHPATKINHQKVPADDDKTPAQVTAGYEKYTKYHFPFPVQDTEQRNSLLMYILPFLPINFFLTLSFFLHLSLIPLLLVSLQEHSPLFLSTPWVPPSP
jgi:hypothetical protein